MGMDSSSIISSSAKIHPSVDIGPFCIIGDDVELGEGTSVLSHAIIKGPTKIGKNNVIYQFSSIGEDTTDKKYDGEDTKLIIGDNNIFREGVTVHRGTVQDKGVTKLGVIIYLWHILMLHTIASLVTIIFLQIMPVLLVM